MSSYEGDPVCCLVQEYSVKTSICEVMEIIRTKQKRNSMGRGYRGILDCKYLVTFTILRPYCMFKTYLHTVVVIKLKYTIDNLSKQKIFYVKYGH